MMMSRKRIDISSQSFGLLTVLSFHSSRPKGKQGSTSTFWLCRCVCGKETVVAKCSLTSGSTQSCGCVDRKNQSNPTYSNVKALMYRFRKSASKRGYSFSLLFEEVLTLIEGDCYYCGCTPGTLFSSGNRHHPIFYNGIDRVDNSIGYVVGNVVSCCETCNVAKHTMSISEFKKWIERVYQRIEQVQGKTD